MLQRENRERNRIVNSVTLEMNLLSMREEYNSVILY